MLHVIPYTPRPLQWRFHQERTRFCVMLCHRRFGKTVAAVNDLIRQALLSGREDWRAAYAAPFLGQAKAVAWDYCRRFAGAVPGTRFLESELACLLPTGGRIRLLGTENAQALRGLYLDDLVLDEPADMPRQVWSQVLRPMLADRQGRALFCGTPHGTDNLLYDAWQQAGADQSGLWSRFRFPASQTGYLPQAELEAARQSMEAAEFAQEFECSFAAAVRGAYYAPLVDAAEREGRIAALPVAPELPVHTAWDLGMDDATAIWFFQVEPSGTWRFVDYYEASGEGLAHYVRVLEQKARPAGPAAPGEDLPGRGFCYGQHLAPQDIRVRELGTGQSRWECAARMGLRFSLAPALPLADGIDAVRRLLPRCWFDAEHCATCIKALRAYRRQWRPGGPGSGPLHDWTSHGADALRYAATGFRPVAATVDGCRRARTRYNMFGED